MSLKDRILAAYRAFGEPGRFVPRKTVSDLVNTQIDKRLTDAKFRAILRDTLRDTLREELANSAATPGVVHPATAAAPDALATAYLAAVPRWDRVRGVAQDALHRAGVTSGRMLEIGGRLNPRNKDFPGFAYFALDLEDAPGAGVDVMVGDITACPHIPDGSYDFIFSFDVFEHIDRPWLAAAEITRLLRPGGVTMHSTLFAWRYHPCPIDYWRYSAAGLKSLFPDLECLVSEFDMAERRRNIMGNGGNAMTPDALGGWRENVRVNYAGMKPKA